jgi:hypothetical protein
LRFPSLSLLSSLAGTSSSSDKSMAGWPSTCSILILMLLYLKYAIRTDCSSLSILKKVCVESSLALVRVTSKDLERFAAPCPTLENYTHLISECLR